MKKICVVLCLLCGLCGAVQAQTSTDEVVYMKNGTIIRGVITELKPDESVKIQTADGNVFVFGMDEVDRITKEPRPKVRRRNFSDTLITGYRGFVEVGMALGTGSYERNRLEVSTSHGYQFNPYLFLGGGVGVHYYFAQEEALVPFFADFRVNCMKGRVIPFVDIKLGYSLSFSNDLKGAGLYVSPSAGVRLGLPYAQAIQVGLGFTLQRLKTYDFYYSSYEESQINCPAIHFKIGYEF